MYIRPRRNRKSQAVRDYHRETWLAPQHLVLPLFIHGGEGREPIASMPGCDRLSLAELMLEVEAHHVVTSGRRRCHGRPRRSRGHRRAI